MEIEDTDPAITATVCDSLLAWKQDQPIPQAHTRTEHAAAEQQQIGWRNMVQGCLSKHWQEIQAQYFLTLRSRQSPKRWTSSLVQKLWDVAWDQWDHRNDAVHKGAKAQC